MHKGTLIREHISRLHWIAVHFGLNITRKAYHREVASKLQNMLKAVFVFLELFMKIFALYILVQLWLLHLGPSKLWEMRVPLFL